MAETLAPAESAVAAAVAAVIDSRSGPVPLTRPDGSRHERNNPLTGPLQTSADGPISPRIGRPPVDESKLSQNPEAIRARQRRKEQQQKYGNGTAPADARPKFKPSELRALPPGPPVVVVPSPDELQRTTKTVALVIRTAGLIAVAVLKNDGMAVNDDDANEVAALVVDGWPELASGMGGDAKKMLAVCAVGSLVIERVGRYKRGVPTRSITPPPAAAAPDDIRPAVL